MRYKSRDVSKFSACPFCKNLPSVRRIVKSPFAWTYWVECKTEGCIRSASKLDEWESKCKFYEKREAKIIKLPDRDERVSRIIGVGRKKGGNHFGVRQAALSSYDKIEKEEARQEEIEKNKNKNSKG
jgi:hypothetical protein